MYSKWKKETTNISNQKQGSANFMHIYRDFFKKTQKAFPSFFFKSTRVKQNTLQNVLIQCSKHHLKNKSTFVCLLNLTIFLKFISHFLRRLLVVTNLKNHLFLCSSLYIMEGSQCELFWLAQQPNSRSNKK